jgi:EAL and modified HD-GYP domain-containing signal transduction protein
MQLASIGAIGETRRKISSLRDALVLAGTWRIQAWVALLLAQPTNPPSDGGVMTALVRARAVELLARSHEENAAEIGFAAGMLSSFEHLLQIPAEDLQRTLPLSDELREAAFGDVSLLGRIVRDVDDYLTGTNFPRMLSGVDRPALDEAMAGAFSWAASVTASMD